MSLNLPLWSLKSLVFKLFTVTHWWLSVVCSKFALCGFWFTRKMSDNKLLGSFYINCLTFLKGIKTICKRGKEKPKCCFKKFRRETATRWRFCGTAATFIHPSDPCGSVDVVFRLLVFLTSEDFVALFFKTSQWCQFSHICNTFVKHFLKSNQKKQLILYK